MSSTTASAKPNWVELVKNHIKKNFNPTQSVFAHVVESNEHLEIMRLLQMLQFEINKKFNPKFMWETATKKDLQAVLAWIVISNNMIKSSEESLIMAITTINICIAKIDGNL